MLNGNPKSTMKVAIITMPLRHNYGGIIQNYALQQAVKNLGYDVETLEVLPGTSSKSGKLKAALKKMFFYLVDDKGRFLHLFSRLSSEQMLGKNTRGFIRRYIALNQKLYKPRETDYDVFIVGSDQVWRPMYSDLNLTFLDFAKEWKAKKRIAYAASFGTDKWEYTEEQTKRCSELLSLFDAVSVREQSGIKLCQEYLNVKAMHVLDPTLLHDKVFYETSLGLNSIPCKNKGLYYYFLDKNEKKEDLIKRVENGLHCGSYTVNSRVEDDKAPITERIQPPIEEWLCGFRDADFVVTDSFHGTVFSMIFNKPFIVVGNGKRGMSRFESLLAITGQEYRLIYEEDVNGVNTKEFMSKPNIDIKEMRELSMFYLKDNLI